MRRIIVLLLAILTFGTEPLSVVSSAAATNRIELSFDWITELERPLIAELSPDGNVLFYVTVRGPAGPDSSLKLHVLDLQTKQEKFVKQPNNLDRLSRLARLRPRWHPDGKHYFYAKTVEGRSEVWRGDFAGAGEGQVSGRALETLGLKNTNLYEYSLQPGGKLIATIRNVTSNNKALGENSTSQLLRTLSTERAFFGYPRGQQNRAKVTLIDTDSGEEQILKGDFVGNLSGLSWSPDGKKLVVLTSIGGWTWSKEGAQPNPHVIDISSRKVSTPIITPNNIDLSATWSPNGEEMVYLIRNNIVPHQFGSRIYSLWTTKGDGKSYCVAANLVGDSLYWNRLDGNIYLRTLERSTRRLTQFNPSSSENSKRFVTPNDLDVQDHSFSGDGSRAAVIMSNRNTPAEVFIGDIRTKRFEKLTDFAAQLKRKTLGEISLITWPSGDRRFEIEGFLVKPPNYDKTKKYPLLLNMHGGPADSWINEFQSLNFDDSFAGSPQLLAQNGYLVLLPNPRGDPGYGVEFSQALSGHIGDDVRYDCIAGVDYLVKEGIADPDRLGVMGHSYGAVSTYLAASQTTRFKAAVADDGLSNFFLRRIKEIPDDFDAVNWIEYYMGGRFYEVTARWLEASPIRNADRIRTPMLMRMNAASDSKEPLDQHMEMYYALEKNQVPVELLAYVGEGHVMQRGDAIQDYIDRRLAWFNYWILDKPYPNPDFQKKFDAYKVRMRSEGAWRN